jgi:hypothetical protein
MISPLRANLTGLENLDDTGIDAIETAYPVAFMVEDITSFIVPEVFLKIQPVGLIPRQEPENRIRFKGTFVAE